MCAAACAYFLQELAELSAFGISGAQILFRCHHCADAAPICILSWAVHLPPLLWPDGLHTGTQAQSWIQSPHAYRQTHWTNTMLMMSQSWNCGTRLLCILIFILMGHQVFCLVPPTCQQQRFLWHVKKCCCCKIFLHSISSEFSLQQKIVSWPWWIIWLLKLAWLLLTRPSLKVLLGDADKPDLWVLFLFFITSNMLHSTRV